jgi:uncharacterized DUF497 family protein
MIWLETFLILHQCIILQLYENGTNTGPERKFSDRLLVVGKIAGEYWSGVITYRGDKIRIISVRRARKEEVNIYESS